MPRALFSVYDKTGLIEFARGLVGLGWELIASGGTARALAEAGLAVIPVEQVTGAPEMLGGRVKTLHPAIHGPILARDTQADMQELAKYGYTPIDMVVCNLYPFQETVARGAEHEEVIEQIDIGGVTLLRAAAKSYARVIVLCDPGDYQPIYAALRQDGDINPEKREALAGKAFNHTRDYDAAIADYFARASVTLSGAGLLPDALALDLGQSEKLRYGENPHQQAAFYPYPTSSGPLDGMVLGGKALSYNNMLDLDAAWRAVELFETPTVVIVKHLTPCGIASGDTLAAAYPAALASDPVSAFGGVIAVNRRVDDAFVEATGDLFLEAIAAPEFTPTAQEMLAKKRKNCRLLCMNPKPLDSGLTALEMRSVRGGLLLQTIDKGDPETAEWRVVTGRQPTQEEMAALRFAWKACQVVKSNAIVLAVKNATVGIGGGLPSRVDAARLAVEKAGDNSRGSVLASDAFFPFPDALQVGIAAGVTAAVAPGGSVRDDEVIAAADAAGIAMVFTGVRHFRH
jgi:phosphoribosylaminoimidazolecarboxamide formyltransferase/IMP cyclohydrolase